MACTCSSTANCIDCECQQPGAFAGGMMRQQPTAPPPQQQQQLARSPTSAASSKAAPGLFEQLHTALQAPDGEELVKKTRGVIVFVVDDETWTLDSRDGQPPSVTRGGPPAGAKPDLTLTMSDENFAKMVMGKLSPQQAFLLRKLKLSGSMGLALKLQPILDAAAPRAKL